MKELSKVLNKIFGLLKLETMTVVGRVNLVSIIVLVFFIVAYTTNDMFCYLISAVRDAVKTIALHEDISDTYQTVNVFKIMIPVILLIVFCVFFLHINEKAKEKLDENSTCS